MAVPLFDPAGGPWDDHGDGGASDAGGRMDASRVRPVTLLDRSGLLDRAQARSELGIDQETRAVLVTLGGGNLNDITSDLDVVADVVGRRPGWRAYATQAPISRNGASARDDIETISPYRCRDLWR